MAELHEGDQDAYVPDIFIRVEEKPKPTEDASVATTPHDPSLQPGIYDFADKPLEKRPTPLDEELALMAEDFDDAFGTPVAAPNAPPPTPEERIALLEQDLDFLKDQHERLIRALIVGDQGVLQQLRAETEERDNETALRLWKEVVSIPPPSQPVVEPPLKREPSLHQARKILEKYVRRQGGIPT